MISGFHVVVLTLFPEFFPGPLGGSILGRALAKRVWTLTILSLKPYGKKPYGALDDTAYGGGAGMVMRPDLLDHALVEACRIAAPHPLLIYPTPRGAPLTQAQLRSWSSQGRDLVVLCGRYEGIDQRVIDHWNIQEVCVGDIVLCGGEIPAMAMIEGCVRLLPGVLGNAQSAVEESFSQDLLEHPLYTKPRVWKDKSVPEVLLSGHHQRIQDWKMKESCSITRQRRPDLWQHKEPPCQRDC